MTAAGYNGIPPYLGGSTAEALEAIGITQFPSGTNWYQTIGGLLVQGGVTPVLSSALLTVPYNVGFPTQVLGVFIQVVGAADNTAFVTGVTANKFDIQNGVGDRTYYWWAIGV